MSTARMPSLFLGHGSPMAALEDTDTTRAWRALGERLPRPRAVLALSAHWETKGMLVTAAERPRTIHDFYGFPQALYEQQYGAPGDPALARQVAGMLAPYARADLDSWGYDHGTWSVLTHMYPQADVPVIQLSMDIRLPPQGHYQVGQALAPLRDQGVLIMGTGNIVHNLRLYDRRPGVPALPFAQRFTDTVKAKVQAHDHAALIDYASLDPEVHLAFPEPEHFHPLLYVLGTQAPGERTEFITDEVFSSISMTSVLVGAEPLKAAA
jgi:4,5-DOPA dioxygenase extradiol